jgi:hypothetical protein
VTKRIQIAGSATAINIIVNQMHGFLLIISFALTFTSFGQYPFEHFPAIKYRAYNSWKQIRDRKSTDNVGNSLTLRKFFNNGDSFTIRLTASATSWDTTHISMYRNDNLLQTFIEPLRFNPIEPLILADFNGDGLQDLKIIFPYMGNGIASLNVRVVYLMQHSDNRFTKISYFDKMGEHRPERDFNGDKNYEIITMTLVEYKDHSYWSYNLFNFKNFDLVSVNKKYNYPILIQFLYHDNYKITNKVTRKKMKEFAHTQPEEYLRQ